MRYMVFLFLILFNLNFISASCSKGQIDINSASETELDKLYGIGPAKANAIIDARPFDSLDDLLDVNGIGEVTLEKIKEQGLACVEKEKEEKTENKNIDEDDNKLRSKESIKAYSVLNKSELKDVEVIKLAPKDIKSEEGNQNLISKYMIYGLAVFFILLCFLFILNKRKYKNEFK